MTLISDHDSNATRKAVHVAQLLSENLAAKALIRAIANREIVSRDFLGEDLVHVERILDYFHPKPRSTRHPRTKPCQECCVKRVKCVMPDGQSSCERCLKKGLTCTPKHNPPTSEQACIPTAVQPFPGRPAIENNTNPSQAHQANVFPSNLLGSVHPGMPASVTFYGVDSQCPVSTGFAYESTHTQDGSSAPANFHNQMNAIPQNVGVYNNMSVPSANHAGGQTQGYPGYMGPGPSSVGYPGWSCHAW